MTLESSEREPSYYEVALTHRQLMVGLVVALSTVVVAFFAGVWIGRSGSSSVAKTQVADATGESAATGVDQITFFGDKKETAPPKKATPIAPKAAGSSASAASPASSGAAALPGAEPEADAMRKTLQAEMDANRVEGAEPAPSSSTAGTAGTVGKATPAPGAKTTQAPPTSPTTAPKSSTATPSPTTAAKSTVAAPREPSAAVPAGALWIQVYSSTNGERANEISAKLKKGGFPVRLLDPGKVAGANYRVRVGPYPDRAKADRAAGRLRREYKLDTWVTDTP